MLHARVFPHQQPRADHEEGVRKRHLVLPFQVVGGGAALQINRQIGDQRNARLRRNFERLDFEFGQLQFLFDLLRHALRNVPGQARLLVVVVQKIERNRGCARGQGDGASFFDFLQRAVERLGLRRGAD